MKDLTPLGQMPIRVLDCSNVSIESGWTELATLPVEYLTIDDHYVVKKLIFPMRRLKSVNGKGKYELFDDNGERRKKLWKR